MYYNVPTNKFSVVEAHIFDNIIPKNNLSENQYRNKKMVNSRL